MSGGRFITIEGGDGTGKSTQLRLLAEWLESLGLAVLHTREPGGSDGAEAIRKLLVTGDRDRWTPWSEALLHFAARVDHVERTIKPALEAGKWVISDRFYDSTLAYQGAAQGLGVEKIDQLRRLVMEDFEPDLTLILDLESDKGLERARTRAEDTFTREGRYERMGVEFQHRLHTAYRELAEREPDRCVLIPAQGKEGDVAERIRHEVTERLGPGEDDDG